MKSQVKLPSGAQEKFIAERQGYVLFVCRFDNGDPKNRITIRPVGNTDPTKDIVFDAVISDGKLVLQYPLYFKLERMYKMMEFIRDNEKPIIETGKEIWKS